MNPPQIDSDRLTFLEALRKATQEEGIVLGVKEAGFIANCIKYSPTSPAFSDGQRRWIDGIWKSYAHLMRRPMGDSTRGLVEGHAGARVLPGFCAWSLQRDGDAQRTRCGLPVHEGGNWCKGHAEERARKVAQMKAANKRFQRS